MDIQVILCYNLACKRWSICSQFFKEAIPLNHSFRKLLALGLCVVLAAALLPAASATQVTGADLRAAAVAQAQAIATVPWTSEGRIAKANVIDSRLDAFHAGGILPTTYFEFVRLQFPFRGVMVESNNGSLEDFTAQFDPEVTVVDGFNHLPSRAVYTGMDVNGFIADVISRVSPNSQITTLKQALTDPALEALLPGANLSAASSKAAIGSADAKAAYDKMAPGDLLLAWDNNSVTGEGGKPRIHAMVVQSVDAARNTATVIYPNYALLLWTLECDKCGTQDTCGPTSSALPDHLTSVNSAFGSYNKHSETYPNSGCDGTGKPVYATDWTMGTVSFAELADTGVSYGSVGYLPYTLDVYSAPAEPQVTLNTSATADSLASGFSGTITSNYRIASVEAVLTPKGQPGISFVQYNAEGGCSMDYSDAALSKRLMECEPGSYELEVKVFLGNTDRNDSAFAPISIYKQAFTLSPAAFRMTCDKTKAEQGEPFTLTVTALESGITAMRANVISDADNYVFDLAASKAASPNASFTQKGNVVTVEYRGQALSGGSATAKLVYAPVRSGGWGYSEGITPFQISNVSLSKQADGSGMISSRASGSGIVVEVGLNTQVFRNYAPGYDLLLIYMDTPEMINLTGVSTLTMAYDGKPMYDVTSAHYNVNGCRWKRAYAAIVPNADVSKVALGTEACPIVTYSNNINGASTVDIADLQVLAGIRSGRVPLTGNEVKWLLDDIDRNGVVNIADHNALISVLTK